MGEQWKNFTLDFGAFQYSSFVQCESVSCTRTWCRMCKRLGRDLNDFCFLSNSQWFPLIELTKKFGYEKVLIVYLKTEKKSVKKQTIYIDQKLIGHQFH